jgi:hypothetical protein
MNQQRQFSAPIKAAAVQVFGDPRRPDFQPLSHFAYLADDPESRRRVGTVVRMIIDDLSNAEARGADVGGILGQEGILGAIGIGDLVRAAKNNAGIPVDVAESQVNALEIAMRPLTPDEAAFVNRIFASYGSLPGLRSITRQGAYQFSVRSMERELPIPGLADVNSSRSFNNKLASLAEEIVTGIEGNGISDLVIPQKSFYIEQARRLTALGRGQAPTTGFSRPTTKVPDFIFEHGRIVPTNRR